MNFALPGKMYKSHNIARPERLSHKLKFPVSERKKPSADVRSQRSHLQMMN